MINDFSFGNSQNRQETQTDTLGKIGRVKTCWRREKNAETSTPKMKEKEKALFLLFISVEFWQEKRESVAAWMDGWMELEGVLRRRARDPLPRPRL